MILYEKECWGVFGKLLESRPGERELLWPLLEGAAQELGVVNIGLEAHVQSIADDGDQPDHPVDDQIEQHPAAQQQAEFVLLSDVDWVKADERGDGVADDGDEADDGIEAEADAHKLEFAVEESGEPVDVLQIALGVGLS